VKKRGSTSTSSSPRERKKREERGEGDTPCSLLEIEEESFPCLLHFGRGKVQEEKTSLSGDKRGRGTVPNYPPQPSVYHDLVWGKKNTIRLGEKEGGNH